MLLIIIISHLHLHLSCPTLFGPTIPSRNAQLRCHLWRDILDASNLPVVFAIGLYLILGLPEVALNVLLTLLGESFGVPIIQMKVVVTV